jgi:hypothetical protein
VFVVGGFFMASSAHRAWDRCVGVCNILFFGLGLWIFAEQGVAGGGVLALSARRRVMTVGVIAGAIAAAWGIWATGITDGERTALGAIGVGFALLCLWGRSRATRAAQRGR